MLENFITIFVFNLLIVSILFVISLWIKKADIIDIYWGPAFLLSGLIILFINQNYSLPSNIIIFIIGLWSIRLGSHLYSRNIGQSEDIRYTKIRSKYGNLGLFLINYVVQAALIPIISLPIIIVVASNLNELNFVSYAAIILALIGIVIEALADSQLKQFKRHKINKNKVMNLGLWNYSRHPNYFGNSIMWWGIGIYCFSISFNFFTLISPITMTYLLIKVSGVSMLENQIKHTKDGYEEYIKTTSAFIILPKKKL
jgi:steroid 5-alpha reductase family enzyme